MIITHTDGTSTDTDKLSDINSEILEKAEILRDLCSKAKIPCFILAHNSQKGSPIMFWNISNNDNVQEGYDILFNGIDGFLNYTTNGKLTIKENL